MKEFKFIGSHADELEGGRPIAPGDFTGPIDEGAEKNKQMIEDGLLLDVPDGTYDKITKPEQPVVEQTSWDQTNQEGDDR